LTRDGDMDRPGGRAHARWPGRLGSIVVATLVAAVAVGVSDTAGAPLDSCQSQADSAAEVVTPTPTATARARPTRRAARRAAARRRQAARASQFAAPATGLPRAIDAEGKPIAGAAQLVFKFDTHHDPITRVQAFLIPRDMAPSAVTATVPFQDVTDGSGRPLSASHLRAVVRHTGPARVVTVALCLDPDAPSEMRAGTYTGTALVGVNARVTPVTLQATVQDDRWLLILLFPLAGVVAGLFVRLFADQQSTDHIQRFRQVSRPRVIATIGAGLVVAFYSYRTIYLDDPTFYAGAGDLWRLTAETFAGTLAAKTLTDLAGPQPEPKPAPEPEPEPKAGNATKVTITA
jgi:hypothetical protein